MSLNTSFELYTGIIGVYIDFLRKNKRTRQTIAIISGINVLISILSLIFSKYIIEPEILADTNETISIYLFLSTLFFLLTITSYSKIQIGKDGLSIDLIGLRNERVELKKRFTQKQDDVFNTIQLSLNQLTEYYTINLSQARSSYRWSIAAIIVGIITLLSGIWFFYIDKSTNLNVAIIAGISGTIIEFIGASNMYIYNKSLKQLNLYFNELITIQDTMLAIELCDKIEDNEKKNQIKEQIIMSLMGRNAMRTNSNSSPKTTILKSP